MAIYNNIPKEKRINSDVQTLQAFDNYFENPLEIKVTTYDAMKSFFTSKGFDEVAADSVAVTIIRQAKLDNLNPLQILDTLEGLNSIEISALVAEIINYNRFKTSFLGYARAFIINNEVIRNIRP